MTNKKKDKTKRLPRWYFGGISGTVAAGLTHPLDLMKITLQTSIKYNLSLRQVIARIIKKNNGSLLVFYKGLSASMLRQLTYTTTRFGIYELGRPYFKTDHFFGKILLSSVAGIIGGFVGTPADVVNVRMQNDVKLGIDKRRNYKHAIDGIIRIYKEEGLRSLYRGLPISSCRGILSTIGQIAFYEQIKSILLKTENCKDNMYTHITASLMSGLCATCITHPVDVLKTLEMNSKAKQNPGIWRFIWKTAHFGGPRAFYKGFLPAMMRNTPHTVILYVVFEQLRLNYGIDPVKVVKTKEC